MFQFQATAPLVATKGHATTTYSFADKKKLYTSLTIIILAIGVFLRLYHFIDNRSLWRDELYLAISLVKLNFWELATQPLAYEQKGPLGYLWSVKLFVIIFGKGEMALRLFSLLTGVASIIVFVPVTRFFLKPWAALLALAMLAVATPIVYHSVEAKQYGTELFASIMALYLFLRYHRHTNISSLIIWGMAGAALLWFSYSAIFVLAGIAFAVCLHNLVHKNWRKLFLSTISFGLWLSSFATIYLLFLSKYKNSDWLILFFDKVYHAFMPFPPTSATDLKWFYYKVAFILGHPLGQTYNFEGSTPYFFVLLRLLPLLFALAGIAFLLHKKYNLHFTVIAFPVILSLIASGLKLYPFHERFILFLAPIFILLISYGAQAINAYFPKNARAKLLLSLILLAPPLWNATRELYNPDYFYKKEKNREALLFINDRYKEGDVVYVYWNMWHAYLYYKEAYDLKFTAVEGRDSKYNAQNLPDYLKDLSQDFDKFQGQNRLWYLYHAHVRNNIGGFIGLPAWYFDKSFIPGQQLGFKFMGLGEKMKESFDVKQTVVSLYKLRP